MGSGGDAPEGHKGATTLTSAASEWVCQNTRRIPEHPRHPREPGAASRACAATPLTLCLVEGCRLVAQTSPCPPHSSWSLPGALNVQQRAFCSPWFRGCVSGRMLGDKRRRGLTEHHLLWDTSRFSWLVLHPCASRGALAAAFPAVGAQSWVERVSYRSTILLGSTREMSRFGRGSHKCPSSSGGRGGSSRQRQGLVCWLPKEFRRNGLSSVCFLPPQVSDAENVLGIVQIENIQIHAEAYDVALNISISKGQQLPPKRSSPGCVALPRQVGDRSARDGMGQCASMAPIM